MRGLDVACDKSMKDSQLPFGVGARLRKVGLQSMAWSWVIWVVGGRLVRERHQIGIDWNLVETHVHCCKGIERVGTSTSQVKQLLIPPLSPPSMLLPSHLVSPFGRGILVQGWA